MSMTPQHKQGRNNLKEAQQVRDFYRGLVRDCRRQLREHEAALAKWEAEVESRKRSLYIASAGLEGTP